MHSSQDDNRIRLIQPDDEGCREVHAEVGVAGGERHLEIAHRVGLDKMHIEESLGLQQLFGHILRSHTKTEALDQPERRRLGRRLRRGRPGVQAKEPRCPHERQPTQESPPAELSRVLGTHGNLPSSCGSVRH